MQGFYEKLLASRTGGPAPEWAVQAATAANQAGPRYWPLILSRSVPPDARIPGLGGLATTHADGSVSIQASGGRLTVAPLGESSYAVFDRDPLSPK